MNLLFLVLGLAVFTATHGEWQEKTPSEFQDIHQECKTDSQITHEQFEKIKSVQFPDEEPVRKYVLCIATKLELFCEKEGYHGDRLAYFDVDLEPEKITEIMEKCLDKNEEKSTADVWAFRGLQCVLNTEFGERIKARVKNETKNRPVPAELRKRF